MMTMMGSDAREGFCKRLKRACTIRKAAGTRRGLLECLKRKRRVGGKYCAAVEGQLLTCFAVFEGVHDHAARKRHFALVRRADLHDHAVGSANSKNIHRCEKVCTERNLDGVPLRRRRCCGVGLGARGGGGGGEASSPFLRVTSPDVRLVWGLHAAPLSVLVFVAPVRLANLHLAHHGFDDDHLYGLLLERARQCYL